MFCFTVPLFSLFLHLTSGGDTQYGEGVVLLEGPDRVAVGNLSPPISDNDEGAGRN
jgi:hypothetical protein